MKSRKKIIPFLTIGSIYYQRENYYNAINSYQDAIFRNNCQVAGLHNIGSCMKDIGLQKIALRKLNESIDCLNKRIGEQPDDTSLIYTNRADLLRIFNKIDLMLLDLEKALFLDKENSHYWVVKGLYDFKRGNINNSLACFDKAILCEPTSINLRKTRAMLFDILGENQKSLEENLELCKIISAESSPTFVLNAIARSYYKIGNLDKAKKYYEKFLLTENWSPSFDQPDYSNGIVQFLDDQKRYGFIMGSTFFNKFDSIYFNYSDCVVPPNKGTRVRYTLTYSIHNGNFEPMAKSVESSFKFIENKYFKEQQLFHGIIHYENDTFKGFHDLKYVLIFYPYPTILPFSSIGKIIDPKIKNHLITNGHFFSEILIKENGNDEPIIISVEPIHKWNSYKDIEVDQNSNQRRKRSNFFEDENVSGWYCPTCDGDETTGCQMSDPQKCPYGRGI